MKTTKKPDLSKISSADLAYELGLRDDIALIQWFSKPNLSELLASTNPTKKELEAYLSHLRLTMPFLERIGEEICEDFEDFRNSLRDQKQLNP